MKRLLTLLGFPWTIRTRLSLLYPGAFFVAGVALIVAVYLYLGVVLDRQFSIRLVNDAAPTAEGQLGAPGVLPPRDLMDQADRVSVLVRQARLNTLDTMLMVSLALVGFLTILAGVIGWLVAGQALRPLRDITATARRVADRSLHERIALAGPNDEIKDLADTLDAMLERLDPSFDSQRPFIANASHELRTPLTITRTLIEVALLEAADNDKLRQLGTTLLAVNQRHEKLTAGLLPLAGSEQRAAGLHPGQRPTADDGNAVHQHMDDPDRILMRLDIGRLVGDLSGIEHGDIRIGPLAHTAALGLAEVDMLALKQAGLVGQMAKVVKVVKSGELVAAVKLTGIGATAGARAAIEAAGGSVA